MIPSAGILKIALSRQDGRVDLSIQPPKRLPLEELVKGKPASDVARLVPLIFNICAGAQEMATRSALGLTISPELEAQVRRETLREHVVKLCMVWPTLLGQAAGREALGLVARAAEDPEAGSALGAAIFAPLDRAPEHWITLTDWAHAGATAPARAFAALLNDWDAGWGRADTTQLDLAGPIDWETATQSRQAVENGPASRLAGAALLDDVGKRRGHDMLWRMATRLVEVDRILGGEAAPALAATGVANAARGAMLVDASVTENRVTSLRRLSPTDFALAKGGVLETALSTLPAEADAPLRTIAQMIVETVDPCVATQLSFAEGGEVVGHA